MTNDKSNLNSLTDFHNIVNAAPTGLILFNENFKPTWCNQRVLDFLNLKDINDFIEKFDTLSPAYQPNGRLSSELQTEYTAKVISDNAHLFNWLCVDKTGKEFPLEVKLTKTTLNDEVCLVAYLRDLSNEFIDEDDKNEYEDFFLNKISDKVLLHTLSSLSNEWFFALDIRTSIIQYYGKIIEETSNNTSVSLNIDDTINLVQVHPQDKKLYTKLVTNMKNGIYEDIDIRYLQSDGEYHYFKTIYQTLFNHDKEPIFVLGKGIDVTEQKLFEEKSQLDLLTQCYNKITAENMVTKKLLSSNETRHALFIIDIDNFKAINDNLGHFFGDEVLKEVANNLKQSFRTQDVIARIGGDEFIVFFENSTSKKLLEQKAKLIAKAFSKTYSGADKDYKISGSIGIACYPVNGKTYDDLYKAADKALYQAKMQGKDQYVFFDESLTDGSFRNLTKLENADRMASAYFDYDLISSAFNILYENQGDSCSINKALKFIGQKYHADRCYIHESFDKGKTYNNTYEWCRTGINSELANMQNCTRAFYQELFDFSHNGVIYSNDINVFFNGKNKLAAKTASDLGVVSFLHAQVKKDDYVSFFIGLDDCTKPRVWNEREINSLQYISKMISIILQGRHLREDVKSLTDYNQMSAFISDSSDDIVYVSDLETYDLYYLNKAALNLLGNPIESKWKGQKCYELLQGKNAPCEFCTNDVLTKDDFYTWKYFNPLFNKTYWLKDKLIPVNSKLARLEIATDITNIITLEAQLQEKLSEESLLLSCINTLHSGTDPHISINKLLDIIANFYSAERSYIFETAENKLLTNNTYEWCANGITPQIQNLKNVPIEDVALWYENFDLLGEFYIQTLDENTPGYETLHPQGINSLIATPLRDNDGAINGFLGVDNPKQNVSKTNLLRSVSKVIANFLDETQLLEELHKISYFDILTGVKNRISYSKTLAKIDNMPISSLGIAYVDICGLRAINDVKGTQYGDMVIKQLADILTNLFNKNVYRVGGDEFVVLMQNINQIEFENGITTLKQNIAAQNNFKAAVGSTWNKNFAYHTQNKHASNGNKYDAILASNLEKEIADGKYVVYFQPQINIATGKFHGAEALVRRLNAKNQVDPPSEFIPFYEKEGIISKIDLFIFEEVCKYLSLWNKKANKDLKISVNFSRATITQNTIVNILSDICKKHNVEKSQLVIEITETICGESDDVLSTIINNFTCSGFEVSVDDFGSGYSNFSVLKLADFDELKIDIGLIKELHTEQKSRTLVNVILNLCQQLDNTSCVAEGIELQAQYDLLKQFGCQIGQGYFFDKPMPKTDFEAKYIYNN